MAEFLLHKAPIAQKALTDRYLRLKLDTQSNKAPNLLFCYIFKMGVFFIFFSLSSLSFFFIALSSKTPIDDLGAKT
jgi:hypothetical protein